MDQDRESFLSLLREILEQYTLIISILREVDRSIGDGNRELRDKLSGIESYLRDQITQFAELSVALEDECKKESGTGELLVTMNEKLDKQWRKFFQLSVIISVTSSIIGGIGFQVIAWLYRCGFLFK